VWLVYVSVPAATALFDTSLTLLFSETETIGKKKVTIKTQ